MNNKSRNVEVKWVVYSHVGIFWDGGVCLLGVYRFLLLAKVRCWWHVNIENPYRAVTATAVPTEAKVSAYYEDEGKWHSDVVEKWKSFRNNL